MKRLLQLSLIGVFLFTYSPIQAQFFKKLKKKVSKKVENKVINKSANKAADKTGKTMDKAFNAKIKSTKDLPKPARHYAFTYEYDMKITSKNGNMLMPYYFKPGAKYAGMSINKNGSRIFMVFDFKDQAAYNFMDMNSQKVYTAMSLDFGSDSGNDWVQNASADKSDYTITDLPDKTFLGYHCKGKQIENDEHNITLYYTKEVDFSFSDIFNASKKGPNKAMRKYLKDVKDGMMMYIKSFDKKHPKKSVTMQCVKLKKVDHTFNTGDYQAMGF